ncbi:MAG: peptidyl-prolyl cis-trans isomerase [Gammaproteobacteria bacterium]|nr:peptidyl-prolyl cis-trans isomerase [Gammaproteobacteria bacterium]
MNKIKQSNLVIQKLVQEPTVHFFLMAIVIFVIYAISQTNRENLLEVDQREIDARVFIQEMTTGQPLNDEQRQFIASNYVEEQILVREAIALGLNNDARIHDMLAQKMRHVLSGDVIQPTTDDLNSYYEENLERYRTLPLVSVNELVLNTQDELSAEVQAFLDSGSDAEMILSATAGNEAPLPNVNRIDLANIFSPEFSEQVFNAESESWVGPYTSNRGQHWLKVTERSEANLPPLNEITDRVRLDWIAEEEEILLQQEVDKLWDQYTIIVANEEN